jgi:hypothetical protein
MAIKTDVRARAPRGTKTLTQAFFEALDGVPESQQKAVAAAALAGIRDELKTQRLKVRDAASRGKAKAPARTKAAPARKTKRAVTAKRVPAAAGRKATAKKVATKKVPAKKAAKKAAAPKAKARRTAAPSPAAASE